LKKEGCHFTIFKNLALNGKKTPFMGVYNIMNKKDKDLRDLSLIVKLVIGISASVSLVVSIFIILLFFIGSKI
tara:strand:- start:387 stop:605 length:219 start_codon:yes stop_codon:yes gene_type:complete